MPIDKEFVRDPKMEAEIRREASRRRALERLGTKYPACVICGENDPLCLELHHLPGEKYGNDLVPVCRNCHRKLSDRQKDHADQINEPPDDLEIIAHALLGRADFSEELAKQDRKFAQLLLERANPNRHNVEPGS